MNSQFYSKRHYRQTGGFYSHDTAEQIAARVKRQQAADRAAADVAAKFPEITSENAPAVIAYQYERMKFHGATT